MMLVFCILKYASGWEEDASDVRVEDHETPTNSSQESAIWGAASLIKDPKWYEQRAKLALAAEIKDRREHAQEANDLLDLFATEEEKAFKRAWLNGCYEPPALSEEQQTEQDLEEAESMMPMAVNRDLT
jgi:hypothetical protein